MTLTCNRCGAKKGWLHRYFFDSNQELCGLCSSKWERLYTTASKQERLTDDAVKALWSDYIQSGRRLV
jgi:hypothetical protein